MQFFRAIFILSMVLFFAGCANSVPEIVSVDAFLVCDFVSGEKTPDFRMSVFAETTSDVRRVGSINVSGRAAGYEWRIYSPTTVNGDGKKWAGHTSLMCPEGYKFQQGIYDLVYEDLTGQTKESTFSFSFPDEILFADVDSIEKILGNGFTKNIAVFSTDDKIMYCDIPKEEWKDNDDIFAEYENAKFLRDCYIDSKNSVICIMPPVLRDAALMFDENDTE